MHERIKKMEKKSLLKKLQEENGHDYLETALVVRESGLEGRLVKIGETHQEVKAGISYDKKTFELYQDASDISDAVLDTYQDLIQEVKKGKWKIKRNSKIRKFLNVTSSEFERGSDDDKMAVFGVYNALHCVALGITSLAVGTVIPLVGIPLFAAVGYGIFHRETKLKETKAEFNGDKIRYLKAVHALNAYAQIMEKEVVDIEYDDEVIADYLVDKYGAGGIQEAIDKAQREVKTVKDATGKILEAAGIEPWKIPKDYVVSSKRKSDPLEQLLSPTYRGIIEPPKTKEVEVN